MPCLLKTYTVLGTSSIVIRILLIILKRKQILFIKTNLSSQLLFTEHKVIHVLIISSALLVNVYSQDPGVSELVNCQVPSAGPLHLVQEISTPFAVANACHSRPLHIFHRRNTNVHTCKNKELGPYWVDWRCDKKNRVGSLNKVQ